MNSVINICVKKWCSVPSFKFIGSEVQRDKQIQNKVFNVCLHRMKDCQQKLCIGFHKKEETQENQNEREQKI